MYNLSMWPDMTFYMNLGLQPGVLLPIAGSLLTQFCAIPVLGILLILLSLLLLTFVSRKVIGNNVLALIPAVCAFIFISRIDYAAYTMRAQGVLFSQTLGLTCAMAIIWAWQKLSDSKAALIVMALIPVVGYPLIGTYAIAASLGVMILAIASRKQITASVLITLICAFVVPMVYSSAVFTHIDTHYTYVAGLPYMDFVDNGSRFVPLALAILAVLVLPALGIVLGGKELKPVFSYAVAALSLAAIGAFTYWDTNFHVELKMEQAIVKNDWDKALELSKKAKTPTRVIVMYRNIALMNKGLLGDKMFFYSHETKGINTPGPISQTEVCASLVFFYNGEINYSARWAWEMSMMFQRTIERYKYQAKVALFTGKENPELVETYLRIIERNLFEKNWVRKYRTYLYDRAALAQDPEYMMFQQLDQFEEVKFMSSAVVENTLLNHYVLQENPEGIMLDLSITAAMTMKDIETFWYFYDQYYKTHKKIPTNIAEAAILFAFLERDQDLINSIVYDLGGENAPVVTRFNAFTQELFRYQSMDAVPESFKEKYRPTYWYYIYFVNEASTD